MSRPLRIAVFVYEFPALSETFVLNQVTGLIDLGHDVTIFAVRPRPEPRVHPDVVAYGLAERTRYQGMPDGYAKRLLAGAGWAIRNVWRRPRPVLRCLDVVRHGWDAASLRLLYWAIQLKDEAPFDVIHCHFGSVGRFVAKLRDAGAIRGRLATVFHGVDVSAVLRDHPDYYRFLFAAGDLFLPVSERWRRTLVTLGCDPGRTAVHRMGVDPNNYPFRPRRRDPGRPLTVFTVGRMIEKKGIDHGIRGVAEAIRRGVDLRYSIIGDGPLRARLEDLATSLGLAEKVVFHGWQDQAAVAAFMEAGDVLLAPSVTSADGDQEGIPVTIMEAMAAGMLVVSTEHSGIPELVEQRRSGLLVPEGDSNALADALVHLVGHPESWAPMSQCARDRVVEHYEIGRLNRVLERRFRALANGEPGAAASPFPGPPAAANTADVAAE